VKAGNSLSSWETIISYKRTMPHAVSYLKNEQTFKTYGVMVRDKYNNIRLWFDGGVL
jgi:hypothetical protein